MPAPLALPVLWPIDPEPCAEWEDLDIAVQQRARALASSTLERLVAYRVSARTLKLRPCRRDCARPYPWRYYSGGGGWMEPYVNGGGLWVNAVCGCRGSDGCHCGQSCAVELYNGVRVVSVRLDGNVMDRSTYRLVGSRLHYFGTGECPWPKCQDLSLGEDEVGAFVVEVGVGNYPDALAAWACGLLACEFAKAWTGKKCRLPDNVTSISRQGVNYTLVAGAFQDGLIGIKELDAWISSWNPYRLKQQPAVWSPDR